jgi:hypothetical protein
LLVLLPAPAATTASSAWPGGALLGLKLLETRLSDGFEVAVCHVDVERLLKAAQSFVFGSRADPQILFPARNK